MDNPFGMLRQVAVDAYAVLHSSLREDFVLFTQLLFAFILLKNDKVASYFRIGFVHEQVVRQTDGRNKVCLASEFSTPCEVMNATIPPSRTASNPFRKK